MSRFLLQMKTTMSPIQMKIASPTHVVGTCSAEKDVSMTIMSRSQVVTCLVFFLFNKLCFSHLCPGPIPLPLRIPFTHIDFNICCIYFFISVTHLTSNYNGKSFEKELG